VRYVKSLLCYSSSDLSVIHDEIKFVWWHRYLLVEDFVQESQSVDMPTLLQGFQFELLEQGRHTGGAGAGPSHWWLSSHMYW